MNYRIFGTKTGLVVSDLVLGTATFGTSFAHGTSADNVQEIIRGYVDAGGNFIDTSDFYQLGDAERLLSDYITNRHDYVIVTKYSRGLSLAQTGNNRKVMVQAVEQSLKRLKTDYIDLYFAHFEDGITPVDEIVRGMEDLTRAGKIIYGGLSNFPAWRVATVAHHPVLTSIQVEYNLMQRVTESELLPMADAFGLGVMAYSPMAGGLLTGKYRRGEEGRASKLPGGLPHAHKEKTEEVLDLLIEMADELGVQPGQIALAWVKAKGVFTIIGARTLAQLNDHLMEITLSKEQLKRLDDVSALPSVYPHDVDKKGMMTMNHKYKLNFPVRTVI